MFNFITSLIEEATNTNNSNDTNLVEIVDNSHNVLCTYHKDNMFEMEAALNTIKAAYPTPSWAMGRLIKDLESDIKKIKDQSKPKVDTKAAEIARLEALVQQYDQKGMATQAKSVKERLEKLQAKVQKAEAKKEEAPTLKAQLLQELKEKVTPEVAVPGIHVVTERMAAKRLVRKHNDSCWVDSGKAIMVYEKSLGLDLNKIHIKKHLTGDEQMKIDMAAAVTAYIYKK